MATYFSNDLLPGRMLEYPDPWGRTWPQLPSPIGEPHGRRLGCIWDQNKGEKISRPWLGTRTRKEDLQGGAEASVCVCGEAGRQLSGSWVYSAPLAGGLRPVPPPVWGLLLHLSKLSFSSPQVCAACPRAPDILFIQRN